MGARPRFLYTEVFSCLFFVGFHLRLQFLQRVEFLLRAQHFQKLHPALPAIELQGPAQNVALHGDAAIGVHRGPNAHIGDSGEKPLFLYTQRLLVRT